MGRLARLNAAKRAAGTLGPRHKDGTPKLPPAAPERETFAERKRRRKVAQAVAVASAIAAPA